MEIKDILSDQYKKLDVEETLSHALSLFGGDEDDTNVLLVFKDKKFVGIISQRMILRSKRDPSEKIRTLVKPSPKLSIGDNIFHIAKLMFENELRYLPVFDNSDIIGVVRDEDVLDIMSQTEFGNEKIREFMTEDLITVEEDDTIASVINIFRENGISRMPVLSKEKLVGMVTMHDFIKVIVPKNRPTSGSIAPDKNPLLGIPVKSIMSEGVVTIKPDDAIKDAVKSMIELGISGLIISENGFMDGIVTKTDLLGAISRMGQEEKDFYVQFSGEITTDMDGISSVLNKFTSKFEKYLEKGILHIYFKHHGQTHNDIPLVLCKIKISSPKGSFVGKGEGWGEDAAFHIALDHVERHILKMKGITKDKWAEKRFLDKISF